MVKIKHILVIFFFSGVLQLSIALRAFAEKGEGERVEATKEFVAIENEDTKGLPFKVPANAKLLPERALIITTKGPIEVKLYRQITPISVANFQHLGEKGIYEGVKFHRYVPGFVIQGGDPTGTTEGGPGWTLAQEISPDVSHVKGTLGWARLPAQVNPERRSNGSQFYICLEPQPRLDGFYTAFGVVISGMENAERLRVGDKILKVKFPQADLSLAEETIQ